MKSETILCIGLDDTDSIKGMCTTYLGYRLVDLLKKEKAEFVDYPRLVRFNPNVPWKTRGNGAVGLKIKTSNPQKIKKMAIKLLQRYSEVSNGANPAIAFYENDVIPVALKEFSRLALWRLIKRGMARRVAKQNNIESFCLGNGQGLVGAIGVIGYEFDDNTLELLSYRKRSQFGKLRDIRSDDVKRIHEKIPGTFSSYDVIKHQVMIAPRGPDPVFYGIRGDDPDSLLQASKMIKTSESLDGYMLFKSNQGTSDHLRNNLNADDLTPYSSGIITGKISQKPAIYRGGHVFFTVLARQQKIKCVIYKESGITNNMMKLELDDKVQVGGGVRKATKNHSRVLNVEFVRVLHLVQKHRMVNPSCKRCNKKMKSKGKGQGFQCVKCKDRSQKRQKEPISRDICKSLYLPVLSSQRHLTRPLRRQGITNKTTFDNSIQWFGRFN